VRRTFYGQPGFGDDPKRDTKEAGFYLQLAVPICTLESGRDDPDDAIADIRLVQLILSQQGYETFRSSLGSTVTLRGRPIAAHTGHHHAPVLLTPELPLPAGR
jgi:hypothetical protein